MTISTTLTKNSYTANGSQTVFAYTFKVLTSADIKVYLRTAAGVETLQTLTTHYTLSGVGSDSGGNVTFGTAPASGVTVVLTRSTQQTQATDYVANDPFGAETHEAALDKLTMISQEIQEEVDRTVKAPATDTASLELPSSTSRASRLMAFDASGNITTSAVDSLSLATLQSFTDYRISTFTGNGSTASYTLSAEPGQEGNTQVFLDGVYQSKNSYNLVGAVLTFDTNIPSGVAIEVVHGQAAATYSPVAGSITFTHLADTIDEDDMSSNSATKIPTQQSVKAYVDAQVDTVDTLAEVLSNGNGTGGTDIAVGANDDITLVDGSNIKWGTGGDGLGIYHDGSNSYITEIGSGTGNLFVLATDLTLGDKGNQHHYAHFVSGGEAKLFYDNDLKFETTSGGGKIYGDLQVTGSDIELGSGNDTTISRASAGVVTIEGQTVRTGTVAIADGGTGSTSASAARSALGVDAAGTDNSTPVTLAGSLDYLTISGQQITRNSIDLTADVSGALPIANGGTGATTAAAAATALGVGTGSSPTFNGVTATGTLHLDSDGAAINFGDDAEITLTHAADRGLILREGASGATATTSAETLVVESNTRAGISILTANNDLGSICFGDADDADVGGINYDHSGNSMRFVVNGAEKGRVDAYGRWGIGTQSPGAELEIAGDYQPLIVNSTSSSGAKIILEDNGVTRGYLGASSSLPVQFHNSSATVVGGFTGGGALGVNTSSPDADAKLDVNGQVLVRSTGAGVDTTPGGQYGFYIQPDSGGNVNLMSYSSGGSTTIRFYTNSGGAAAAERMSISSAGAVTVQGAFSKGSGSFKIDHPLPAKKDTHHLVHSFVEGPQADLIYRGRATLVDGQASINIDDAAGMTNGTFEVLCRDIQCFTSNETGWTAVRGSVTGATLTIEAQDNSCTDTISWMVVGERQDKHMYDTDWTDDDGKVIVEPLKPVEEGE